MKRCSIAISKLKILISYVLFNIRLNYKLYLRALPQYIFVALCVAPCLYITQKYVEAVFQFIALLFLRYKFTKTYHCNTTAKCLFLTLTIAYLAIPRILPLEENLLSGVIISFVISFLSWAAQELIERRKTKTEWYMLNCDDLRKFACEHGLTKRQTEILVAISNGIIGEKQIDHILYLGFDYSGSTQDREYKEIKRKLGVSNLKIK